VSYRPVWAVQQALATAVAADAAPEALLLLEHPHVYTFGRGGHQAHLLTDPALLARLGAEVVHSDRGGDVTYHGPGQLVGYLVLHLRRRGLDAHQFVRGVEAAILQTLAQASVAGERIPGLPGIWVGLGKIAAVGIRVSRGVSFHGFALNVNTDLAYFQHIVPCGIEGRDVTSLEREVGHPVPLRTVRRALAEACAAVFGIEIRHPTGAEVERLVTLGLEPAWLLPGDAAAADSPLSLGHDAALRRP
jgi:lipoate-protein ligase B